MNDLNSKIAATEEELEKLTSQLNKTIMDQDKSQKEYNSLFKDIETQVDSQSKNLDDLQKEIQNIRYHQTKLKKEINSYKKDIFTKKKTKATFEKELGEIEALEQAAQAIRDKERHLAELQKEKKEVEETIDFKEGWIEGSKERKEKSEKTQKLSFNYYKEQKQEQEKINKAFLESLRRLEVSSKNAIKYHKVLKICEDYSRAEMEKNDLDANRAIEHFQTTIKTLENEISTTTDIIQKSRIKLKSIGNKIASIQNDLNEIQNKIENYGQIPNEMALLMKNDNTSNYNISTFNLLKKCELVSFREQLRVIKKYGKDNNIEEINNAIAQLSEQNQILQSKKNKIEEMKENNWTDIQYTKQEEFEHFIYLKSRETLIPTHKLNDEKFKRFNHEDLCKGKNIQNLKKRSEILEAISKLESEYKTLNTGLNELSEYRGGLNNLINKQKRKFIKSEFGDNENRMLSESIRKSNEYQEKINNLKEKLFQKDDEIQSFKLYLLKINTNICDSRSKEIAAYQSELESFHTKKSDLQTDLQTRIDDELTKIRFQFETDLQNLQKSYDDKTSQLESVQSKLTALEKSVQQETKRQELQDQLDKLASQIDTTRSEKETIAQKLEGHCQEFEELRKALADAEQEKMLLGTRLEESKNKLEEKGKQLKHSEAEWEEKRIAAESAHGLLESCIIKKGQQEKALAKAEEEKKFLEAQYGDSKKRLMYLEKFMQRLNTHLYGKDSFTEGLPPNKWLEQAQEEVKKARTELLNAQIDVSDAVITRAIPDDEDSIRMKSAKIEATHSPDWKPNLTH